MNTFRLFNYVSCSIIGLVDCSLAVAQQTDGAATASVQGAAAVSPPQAPGPAATPTGEAQQAQSASGSTVSPTPEGGEQAPPPALPPRACFPECRAGYLCHEGTCISRCNPPCAVGEQCSESGLCTAPPPGRPPPPPTRATTSATETPPLAPSTAESPADRSLLLERWAIGGAVGVSLPGTIYVGSSGEFDTETSYVLDLFADAIVAPMFSIGGFITHAPLVSEDTDAKLWSLGFTMKARFAMSNRMALRPAVVIGYNSITIDDSDLDAFQGLNVGAHLDLAIALSRSGGLVPRLGFFSQPVGGNGDLDLDFAPIIYAAVGYEFGR